MYIPAAEYFKYHLTSLWYLYPTWAQKCRRWNGPMTGRDSLIFYIYSGLYIGIKTVQESLDDLNWLVLPMHDTFLNFLIFFYFRGIYFLLYIEKGCNPDENYSYWRNSKQWFAYNPYIHQSVDLGAGLDQTFWLNEKSIHPFYLFIF